MQKEGRAPCPGEPWEPWMTTISCLQNYPITRLPDYQIFPNYPITRFPDLSRRLPRQSRGGRGLPTASFRKAPKTQNQKRETCGSVESAATRPVLFPCARVVHPRFCQIMMARSEGSCVLQLAGRYSGCGCIRFGLWRTL